MMASLTRSSLGSVAVGAAVGVAAGPLSRWVRRRLLSLHGGPPVVNDALAWSALHEVAADGGFYAFYSSCAGAITTAPELMHIPIHDHAIVRGHAVFDTCSLAEGRMYRLAIHLRRFLDSAAAARLPLPFGDSEQANIEQMTAVIAATCRASKRRNADVRFWLSAGSGNLGVTPDGCTPGFYVLVFGGLPGLNDDPMIDGIAEATVPESIVPLKPPYLAELKSNNYMLNALTMMAARDRGGRFGIGIDAAGHVRESCVLNVLSVGADGVLRTPPFKRVLAGTTARRSFELARESLLADGTLSGVVQEELPLATARAGTELILVAGDTHLYPITTLDGEPVGDGRVGPVAKALLKLLKHDAVHGDGDHQAVPGL
tara:strand:+ start:128 stop:1246 length:1119 start_codon:yes stop_codon:yes gene_type:complete